MRETTYRPQEPEATRGGETAQPEAQVLDESLEFVPQKQERAGLGGKEKPQDTGDRGKGLAGLEHDLALRAPCLKASSPESPKTLTLAFWYTGRLTLLRPPWQPPAGAGLAQPSLLFSPPVTPGLFQNAPMVTQGVCLCCSSDCPRGLSLANAPLLESRLKPSGWSSGTPLGSSDSRFFLSPLRLCH